MTHYLHIGGLVALGFAPTGRYMLAISHAGRGVFTVGDWIRVARDYRLAYPDGDVGIGIGPIEGQRIRIVETELPAGHLAVTTPDGLYRLDYEDGTVKIDS